MKEQKEGKKPSILVIDDDEDTRKVLIEILKDNGYNADSAETGGEVEPPILPREAVQWAWGLTIGQSSVSDAEGLKVRQKEIQDYIDGLKGELVKTGKASQQDIRYIDGVYAAINSCVRTLHIIAVLYRQRSKANYSVVVYCDSKFLKTARQPAFKHFTKSSFIQHLVFPQLP